MTEPSRDRPVVVRDPEAHQKLDRILEWIQGDGLRGITGAAARILDLEERLDEQDKRINRHSERIRALETRGAEQLRWTVKTFVEKAIGLAAAGVVGALAAIFAAKPPAP